MRHMFYLIIILAFGSSTIANASEVIGSITGEFNGEKKEWSTVLIDGVASTGNFDEFIPGFTAIHIQGQKDGEFSVSKSFSIDFTLRKNGYIDEPSLTFIPGKSLSEYYEAKDVDVKIEIKALESESDVWEISGQVTGQMVRTKREGLKFEVNKTDVIEVDVVFETKLYRPE